MHPVPRRLYPRTYHIDRFWLTVDVVAAGISLVIGLLGIFLLSNLQPARLFSIQTLVRLVPFPFVYAGIFGIANDLTASVILYGDAIEVIRSLRRRSLRRNEIVCCRFIPGFKGPGYIGSHT
jgi:hypothetical protein